MARMLAKGDHVHNNEEAEALACLKAVEFSMDAGFSNLVIEGDNLNVMRAILSSAASNSLLGHIVDDIRYYISGREYVSFSCVQRGGNMVAYSLAKFARNIGEDMYGVEDEPPPTLDALYHDRLHINERVICSFSKKKKIHILIQDNTHFLLFIYLFLSLSK